jgi:Flp pilus assembly protein protease CpaA
VIMYKDMLHMIIENRFLAVGSLSRDLHHKYLYLALPIFADTKEQ